MATEPAERKESQSKFFVKKKSLTSLHGIMPVRSIKLDIVRLHKPLENVKVAAPQSTGCSAEVVIMWISIVQKWAPCSQGPLEHSKVSIRGHCVCSVTIPPAGRILSTQPLENLQVTIAPCCTAHLSIKRHHPFVKRAPFSSQPLQDFEVAGLGRVHASPRVPRARRIQTPQP